MLRQCLRQFALWCVREYLVAITATCRCVGWRRRYFSKHFNVRRILKLCNIKEDVMDSVWQYKSMQLTGSFFSSFFLHAQ